MAHAGVSAPQSILVTISMRQATISSHGYDPGLPLPWSRKLSANWTAAGQIAPYWPITQVDTRALNGESTFFWIGNLPNQWMRSSSMPATFRGAATLGTCCI
jgi:hypothetical protein